jgi:hypothetical protein
MSDGRFKIAQVRLGQTCLMVIRHVQRVGSASSLDPDGVAWQGPDKSGIVTHV